MGLWSFYFLAKLYLYFRGFIRLDFFLNLLFMAFLVMPPPKRLKPSRSFMIIKSLLSLTLGLLLLWHDSWLPPIINSIKFISEEGMPSKEYIYRFILGFFNPQEIVILAFIMAFCILVQNYIRLTPVVIILILIIPIREYSQPNGQIDRYLDAFYKSESSRVTHFKNSKMDSPAFDIVILHVCSLSWDDLKGAGLEGHPFFKQFDYLFTNFNTVTSYSNPSAIRLLRSNCGQSRHDALYNDTSKECYLFESLRGQGYETYFALNHDGTYGNFADEVRRLGGLDEPFVPKGLPVQAYSFDGSSIFDNYTQLEKVWAIRQRSNSKRAAIYYNTISLHDGAHWADDKDWWKKDLRLENYKEFVQKLLGDITKFFNLIESSGRNVVILFVPEHGMALRGSNLQAPGLRDIPLPQITIVPAGIKFIGKGHDSTTAHQQIITKPASYLSLSYILSAFVEQSPFHSDRFINKEIIDDIPQTDFVAENQGIQLVKKETGYFIFGKGKKWIALPDNALK